MSSAVARGQAFALLSVSAMSECVDVEERPHVWMILGRGVVSGRCAWTGWKTSARSNGRTRGRVQTKIPPQARHRQTHSCPIGKRHQRAPTHTRAGACRKPPSNQNVAPLVLGDLFPRTHRVAIFADFQPCTTLDLRLLYGRTQTMSLISTLNRMSSRK